MKNYLKDLLSCFLRSRTLGIKGLWVAGLVRPPGDSQDCSSMMWQDIWTHQNWNCRGKKKTPGALTGPTIYKCADSNWTSESSLWQLHSFFQGGRTPTLNGITEFKNERILTINLKRVSVVTFKLHPSGTGLSYQAFVPLAELTFSWTKCKSWRQNLINKSIFRTVWRWTYKFKVILKLLTWAQF